MGVRLVLTREDGMEEARGAVEEVLAAFDRACSRFREDSELSVLNRAGGCWTPAGPLLLDALAAALWAASATAGAVDPTVGRALRVTGYDRDFASLPADGGPIRLRLEPVPGGRAVQVDRAGGRARLAGGAEVDLGATAKGLAADRAAAAALAALAGSGRESGVLVSLGGDIAVAGPCPGDGWPVLVAEADSAPLDAGGEVVLLAAGGLATSSTTVRRWARGGAVLHHIIDPATGGPVRGPWRTATVAAGTCLAANTAATAAIVMGDSAPAWLAEHGLPARLVGVDGAVVTVGEWPEAAG